MQLNWIVWVLLRILGSYELEVCIRKLQMSCERDDEGKVNIEYWYWMRQEHVMKSWLILYMEGELMKEGIDEGGELMKKVSIQVLKYG